jgi:glycosidase
MNKTLILLLLFPQFIIAQIIERVEPSSWWIGMNEPTVQLLVHGENIATYEPSLKYKGVTLAKVHKTENPNYLFLDLIISPKAKAGSFAIVFDNDTSSETYSYELKTRVPQSSQREGFNTSDVIYLITPDRFANGNPKNDNIEGYDDKTNRAEDGRHGGDIQGIINHLDYISDMGFTAIWPMPLEENNMQKWSYHGYAITDFYKIDPRFGSNDEYINLAAEAKKKGIKIVKDVVLNHCGSNHWWMKDMPSKDWINYGGKFVGTNHRREVHRDIHVSKSDNQKYLDGWFVETMPDMNQRNPFMANYLIQNSLWWIESADLGGFRVDTYPYSDPDFSSRWSKRIMDEYPDFNITSEEWSTNPAITSYWQMGKVNSNGYKSYVPSPMDFPLQDAMVKSLNEPIQWNGDFNRIYHSLSDDFQYADASKLLIFPDNHDMSRIYTQLNENYEHFKMAMVLMATMRGIPQIYYGTEILMNNPNSDSHGEIRSNFPGGFPNMTADAKTGKGLTTQQKEAQAFVKKLLNYRKSNPILHDGKLTHFAPENGIYVYFRHTVEGKVMVILNKNTSEKTLDLSRFREMLPESTVAKSALNDENLILRASLNLMAKSAYVLEY